ncbi:hypothetical protein ACFOQM_12660 [Paenibacillus sp. GCM10012307]
MSGVLGVYSFGLIMTILLTYPTDSASGWINFSNGSEFKKALLIFISLMAVFSSVLYFLRKQLEAYVIACIFIFILSIVFTPFVQSQIAKIKSYEPPIHDSIQEQTFSEVENIIREYGLPYEINLKESKHSTSRSRKLTLILVKTTNEDFKRNEIDLLVKIRSLKNKNLDYSLFLFFENRYGSLALDVNNKNTITGCGPINECKNLGYETN